MKYIILPSKHRLIEYFPHMDNVDKTSAAFKDEFNNIFSDISNSLQPFLDIHTAELINSRAPLSTAFFIKDTIQNKSMLHIGCRHQELDEGFIKYTSNLTGVEINKNVTLRDTLEVSGYKLVISDYIDIINDDNYDVYFFWCGYRLDIEILDNLVNKFNKKGTFLIMVPQHDGKLCAFLKLLREWWDDNPNATLDYCPILFDEGHIPGSRNHEFCKANIKPEWNEWKTFNDMKGVLLLMKIIV